MPGSKFFVSFSPSAIYSYKLLFSKDNYEERASQRTIQRAERIRFAGYTDKTLSHSAATERARGKIRLPNVTEHLPAS